MLFACIQYRVVLPDRLDFVYIWYHSSTRTTSPLRQRLSPIYSSAVRFLQYSVARSQPENSHYARNRSAFFRLRVKESQVKSYIYLGPWRINLLVLEPWSNFVMCENFSLFEGKQYLKQLDRISATPNIMVSNRVLRSVLHPITNRSMRHPGPQSPFAGFTALHTEPVALYSDGFCIFRLSDLMAAVAQIDLVGWKRGCLVGRFGYPTSHSQSLPVALLADLYARP